MPVVLPGGDSLEGAPGGTVGNLTTALEEDDEVTPEAIVGGAQWYKS